MRRLRRSGLTATFALASTCAGLAFASFSAAPAGAALISTGACDNAPLSQPFARWGDTSTYELAPGGDFEGSASASPASWTLTGGAARVGGSEPFAATGTAGSYALALPAGASAQSPFVCVNASYPTFRLFARAAALLSTVLVQVVYKTPLGQAALPLGTLIPGGQWQPTAPLLTGSLVGGLLTGGTAQAALRFTALTGSSRIDDVFVDPRMR